ncbi:MAG: amidohydrolase [Chitinophagales bacterium]
MNKSNESLRITLIQSPLVWENVDANLQHFDQVLSSLQNPTDLIVLPEMFNTGFTMNAAQVAEKMGGKTHLWLQKKAKELQAVITGSIVIEEDGQYFNRLIWMMSNGDFHTYDKRHLFRMAKEHETYTAGNQRLIIQYKGWNICPLVCYDLRFPVWSRNVGNEYDLLIYVANWPKVRNYVWSGLLQARAMENLAYVAGVNRVGEDAKDFAYSGDSTLVDFAGKPIWASSEQQGMYTHELSKTDLEQFRSRFPAWMDADKFDIIR